MSPAAKIRLLLFLLTLGFAATAFTIRVTFKKEEILNFDAQQIERSLHRKEEFLKKFLGDTVLYDSLKTLGRNEEWAQNLVPEFRDEHNIDIQTFRSGEIEFWSGVRILIPTDITLNDGSTFLQWRNGWYEAIKKSSGNFSVVCFIPIKSNYPYQNQYLKNNFSPDLTTSDNLDMASLNDREVYTIRNIDGKYLFSVKLKSSVTNTFYSSLELWMWVFSVVFALIFIHYVAVWIAEKGNVKIGTAVLFTALLVFRLFDLEFRLFDKYFNIGIFDPRYYASNYFFPSIGHFLLNVLATTWFLAFLYSYRSKLYSGEKPLSRPLSYLLFIFLLAIIGITGLFIHETFFGLVGNSNIDFDVTNVLNLNWLSWLGISILCFSALNLYLLTEILLAAGSRLNLNNRERLVIFSTCVILVFFEKLFFDDFTIFFLLFGMILLLRGWVFYEMKMNFHIGVFIFTVFIFGIIASVKLSRFQFLKERESRKVLATKLESSDDPDAVLLFLNMENEIINDNFIINYFESPIGDRRVLTNRLQKLYFEGYLSKYEFKSYEYNQDDQVLKGDNDVPISNFKNLVVAGSLKVSKYFYRRNNTFGFQNYFALLPIRAESGNKIGTLVIELKTNSLNNYTAIPELLVDGKIPEEKQYADYSYALYTDCKLLNQHGKYVYNLINVNFKGKAKDFVYAVNSDGQNNDTYSHLVYSPNERKVIVISKKVKGLLAQLASVSFIFLVLLLFSVLISFIHFLWTSFSNYNFNVRNIRWNYLITTNRMLYKTRIQVSMVAAVVFTLLITGFITYYNISRQYRVQQEESILEKISMISEGFNRQQFRNEALTRNEQTELAFTAFADLNAAELNLYDPDGNLLLTTQPKIYENELIARKMNPLAYVYLSKLQKSEYINQEQIALFDYITAYIPLRNNKNEAVAYLGLPYLSNERDYEERIGIFLNSLINVYALVFVAIGFFAVFLANQITSPLTLIQKSLRETKIGRKNESIVWKRNDEIGNLIKEYNNMIAALEESAYKLARSERESAWREMAKQVAHEIKNPLTPLKLGVQLLDKSWRENDPDFEKKFQKFSKSFIEQIESLSHIASEFSNFAKMPDTVLQKVNIRQIIDRSIELYRQMDRITIKLDDRTDRTNLVNGDKDQLLRSFNNLIKNAIEAIPNNRRGLIQVMMYNQNSHINIRVHDNGSGIPDSLAGRIFTPNFTTKSSGTGLGLAFVKQAIENMDGTIRFETRQGEGTTFYITIPAAT